MENLSKALNPFPKDPSTQQSQTNPKPVYTTITLNPKPLNLIKYLDPSGFWQTSAEVGGNSGIWCRVVSPGFPLHGRMAGGLRG